MLGPKSVMLSSDYPGSWSSSIQNNFRFGKSILEDSSRTQFNAQDVAIKKPSQPRPGSSLFASREFEDRFYLLKSTVGALSAPSAALKYPFSVYPPIAAISTPGKPLMAVL